MGSVIVADYAATIFTALGKISQAFPSVNFSVTGCRSAPRQFSDHTSGALNRGNTSGWRQTENCRGGLAAISCYATSRCNPLDVSMKLPSPAIANRWTQYTPTGRGCLPILGLLILLGCGALPATAATTVYHCSKN